MEFLKAKYRLEILKLILNFKGLKANKPQELFRENVKTTANSYCISLTTSLTRKSLEEKVKTLTRSTNNNPLRRDSSKLQVKLSLVIHKKQDTKRQKVIMITQLW